MKEIIVELINIIENGFWMMPNQESIVGFGGCKNMSSQQCTCFTDLGVNNSSDHIKKYGLMGIGVTREFILKMDGRPVWYFLNSSDDIHGETIHKLFDYIIDKKDNNQKLEELFNRMSMLFDYAKPMGEEGKINDEFYDEKEWRIVWNSLRNGEYFKSTNVDRPKFLIEIPNKDIKIILLPDEITKKMLYSDSFFYNQFKEKDFSPSIITWDDYFKIMK